MGKKKLTTPERLVLFHDFDNGWSALHDRDFAGGAEVRVARFVRLSTRDAAPVTPPTR